MPDEQDQHTSSWRSPAGGHGSASVTIGGRMIATIMAIQMTMPPMLTVADPAQCPAPPADQQAVVPATISGQMRLREGGAPLPRTRNRHERRCVLAHGHLPQ